MIYIDEIQKGMDLLASYNAKFVGQAVAFKGTSLTNQVKGYPANRLVELPVAEEFQMGFCIGLALRGQLPVSMYPRSNFAILACNQIVNHLDKWYKMCNGNIKVIIKIAVGSSYPLDPGEQHKANYAEAFKSMCEDIEVVDLLYPHQIYPAYERALKSLGSSILIEHADLYKLEL
jgi:acetoin:2,6-dichlorophenolindophenol oxidoreductase subunit beta